MKSTITKLIALMLCLTLFCGCSRSSDSSSLPKLSDDSPAEQTVGAESKADFRERVSEAYLGSQQYLSQDGAVVSDPLFDSAANEVYDYVNSSGVFPIYSGTELSYYPTGEEAYAAMLGELKKAEDFIFIEYFIIEDGVLWSSVMDILKEKAAQGVTVRVLYDGWYAGVKLPADYPDTLADFGIECKVFSPKGSSGAENYGSRDHRKLMIIDGKKVFTGGMNLADEYINVRELYGVWKDNAIMLDGDAAATFTLLFLQMWNIDEPTPEWERFIDVSGSQPSDGLVLPFGDSPYDEYNVGKTVYLDVLENSEDYVYIMTPYLVLDDELENAVVSAAERGVDVRIILPGIPDKVTVNMLAKTHYRKLHSSGVKIYEYTPGFVHSKFFVSDDDTAVVGTVNLDYRSLYHHFEDAVYIRGSSVIGDIKADFVSTSDICTEITSEMINNMKITEVGGGFLKYFAPMI